MTRVSSKGSRRGRAKTLPRRGELRIFHLLAGHVVDFGPVAADVVQGQPFVEQIGDFPKRVVGIDETACFNLEKQPGNVMCSHGTGHCLVLPEDPVSRQLELGGALMVGFVVQVVEWLDIVEVEPRPPR